MANAVTFWKGTKAAFDTKTIALGRIYFVTDDDNNGALYLGVQGETAVEARLISPARLTALTAEITDNLSTVTAKAVVDFVKAQIEAAFGADSDYADKIAEIEGRLDDVEGILAGYGDESDSYSTVKAHVDAVEAIASEAKSIASAAMEFKGVKATVADLPETAENGDIYYVVADDTEYVYIADKEVAEGDSKWEALGGYIKADVYTKAETDAAIDADVKAAKDAIDAYTVNGKAISTSPVLTGDDIEVGTFSEEGAVTTITGTTTLSGAIKALDAALSDVTGGEGGDGGSLAKKMNKVTGAVENNIVTLTSDGDAKDSGYAAGGEALAADPSDKVLATEKAVKAIADTKVDKTTEVNGKALSADVTLYGSDIATSESDSDTIADKLADRYTKAEVNALLTWQDELEA